MKHKRAGNQNPNTFSSTQRVVGAVAIEAVKAQAIAKAADQQQELADAMRPRPFCSAVERKAWELEQAAANGLRRKEVKTCNRVADQLLREAGFKSLFTRKR